MGLTIASRPEDFESFFELSPDLLCIASFDGFFQRLNSSWQRSLGFTRDELLQHPLLDFVHPEDRAQTSVEIQRLIAQQTPGGFENRVRCKDGSYRRLIWQLVAGADQQRIYCIAREKSGDVVRTQEALNAIIAAAPAAIIALDRDGNVTKWNPAAEKIYGWSESEVLGRPLPYLTVGDLQDEFDARVTEVLQGKALHDQKARRFRKDGKEVEVRLNVAPMKDEHGNIFGHVGIAIDVTETKALEKQLLRAQRMNSLGALAGGIAHDLNNILAPILMAAELLNSKFPDPASRWLLDTIETSARRGSDLAKQVLTFARGLQNEKVPVQVGYVIRDIRAVLDQSLPKGIQIVSEARKDLWAVVADATQLHQVVLNLCINARDAMSAGGTLTISAENIVLDDSFVATHPQSRSGHCVVISVTDTGCGIPPNHLDKIFEPFFTTKDHGKGTGLGLSTSLAIVKAHSGFIDVHSEVGRGTTFRVYLPAKPSVAVGSEQEAAPIAMGNQELILIVDDEAAVRNIARATLEAYNYRVITAKDGADGIAMFAKNKDEVRLILSDNNMPVMDGAAMLRVIVKIKPDAKVICVSGMGPADDNNLDSMAASVLPKPFTAEQLVRAVTNALKGSADSARQHAGGLNS